MSQYENIDQRILDTIELLRDEHGSCTAGMLARRMRMSRDTMIERCRSLRERGMVSWTAAAGSLRVIKDPRQRLYDLMVQRAVETQAIADSPDPVSEWCYQVVSQATAVAWPELTPQGREPEGEPGPSPAPDGAEPSTAPVIRCEPCDRIFKNKLGLSGHERSAAHLARLAEAS